MDKRLLSPDLPEGDIAPFTLDQVFADPLILRIFSESTTIDLWLRVEVALSRAQRELGMVTPEEADQIERSAAHLVVDTEALWASTRTVGYPILPLVRALSDSIEHVDSKAHLGATTQDIMDTALALQLQAVLDRLLDLVETFGNELASLVDQHSTTVMAGRTHGQHAVPITFGYKLALYLDEIARHRQRLREIKPRIAKVSLFGAGGTGASLGSKVRELRMVLANELGLSTCDVPWHVSRDSIQDFGAVCSTLAATVGRFGREVADLSRTEIGEVREIQGHHRGASSTMPQKENPIASEMVIAYSTVVGSLLPALHHAAQPRHERATGEWQVEWIVVPQIAIMTSSALRLACEIAAGLVVDLQAMSSNLDLDGGLILAEAYMMRLAPLVGREQAHDIVYEVAMACRESGASLVDGLRELPQELVDLLEVDRESAILPADYVGEAGAICERVLTDWRATQSTAQAEN